MQLGGVTEILTILANKLPRPIPSSYPSPTTTALTNTTLTDERLSLFTHLIRCLCNLSRNSSNKLVIANSGLQSLLRLGLTIITSFAPTPYNQLTIFNATARSVSDDITHQNILSAVDAHDNDDGDKSEVKMSRIATSAISADSNNPFSVQEEEKRMHAEILFHTVGVVRNLCVDPTLTQKLLSNELVQDFVLNVMHQTNSALNVNHLCSRDFASTASRSDASRSITDIDAQADIATSRGKRHNERGDDTRDGGKHQTSTVSDTVDEDDDRRTDDNVRLTLATKVECVESLAFLRGFCSSISSISSPLQSSDAIGAPHSSLANEDAALRAIRFLVLHEEIQQVCIY